MSTGRQGGEFIVVGENVHCTLVYKVGGAFVKVLEDGGAVVRYKEEGQERMLPVPRRFMETEDWNKGVVKHAAVAMWQGLYGDDAGREAGAAYIRYMARRQEAAGARFLDLNVDEFSTDTEERKRVIRWAAGEMQKAASVPLSIDSSNLEILQAGLEACEPRDGKPMVNSVSLEREEALQIARDAGAVVVAAATGAESMPEGVEDRMANIRTLAGKLTAADFALADIYVDPLVFPASVDSRNGPAIIETIKAVRAEYGDEIHFAPGLSNISYGMPNRKLLNQVFAYLCREAGMDGAIVNPVQINGKILDSLDPNAESFALARDFLMGQDQFGMNYIAASREGKL